MLKFRMTSQRDDGTRRLVARMSPTEFLDWYKIRALDEWVTNANRAADDVGSRVEAVDGVAALTITDAAKHQDSLTECGVPRDSVLRLRGFSGAAEVERATHTAIEAEVRVLARVALEMCGPHQERLRDVPVGVVYQSYLNAGAGSVPGGGDVVTIHKDIFAINVWSRYFGLHYSQGAPLEEQYGFLCFARKAFGSHDRSVFYPAILFETAIMLAVTSEEPKFFADLAKLVVQLFVILHEFGHIACGHTDTARTWSPESALSKEALLRRRAIERRFEFEADDFAIDVLFGKYLDCGRVDRPFAMVTLRQFFRFLELGTERVFDGQTGAGEVIVVRRSEPLELRTHPPPAERGVRISGEKPPDRAKELTQLEIEYLRGSIGSLLARASG